MIGVTRRRVMGGGGGSPVSPYDEYGYIADGKLFHLDGIDKGATDGTWVDRINGCVFSAVSGTPTSSAQGFTFNNARMEGTCSLTASEDFTVEVCFSSDRNTFTVFGVGNGNTTSFPLCYVNNKSSVTFLQRQQQCSVPSDASVSAVTLSMNLDGGLWNGASMSLTSADYWSMSGGSTTLAIGKGSSGGSASNYMQGTIYSIRIYGRRLSVAEMLSNQQVDNTRFNLGITI